MFGFNVRAWPNGLGSPRAAVGSPTSVDSPVARVESPRSPKVDVGEIDTRAPFESVKAAVSLFGEVLSPRARPVTKKTKAEEQKLLERETQHHMILRELDYYKEQLRITESAKSLALKDFQRANRTLQELTNKLETLSESKQSAIKTAETAKRRAKELEEQQSLKAQLGSDAWKLDVDTERERYKTSSGELIAGKQELATLRQDFDAALEAKLTAFQEAEDARQAARINQERERQLAREVSVLKETLDQVREASQRAQEENLKLIAEKEVHVLVHKSAKEVAEKDIERLREEYGPEENLEEKLDEANQAIRVLQEQINDVRASDLCSLKEVLSELDSARRELQQVVDEEISVRRSADELKEQLEEVKMKHLEWENNALEAESTLGQIQADLESKKAELELAISRSVLDDMKSNLEKLLAEGENNRNEAEEIYRDVELLKQEADVAKAKAQEADEKLQIALKEAEAARVAEKLADDQIHNSPRSDEIQGSGSSRRIRLTVEEFESMKKKFEECKNKADEKVAALIAQVEAINAGENEVLQKVEAMVKENEDIKSEIEDALRSAEQAEVAKKVVEGELQKWRKKEDDDEVG